MAAALHRAEQLGVVTDAVPLLLSYVDAADLRYRFVNHTYEHWFGHPPAQVEGRTMEEVLGPAAFALLRPYVEAALAGQEVTFEQEVPYKHGGLRRVHGTYVPDRDEHGQVRALWSW
jgi:PAS domain S-box-containing protein